MSCGCSHLFKIPSDQSGCRVSPEGAVSDTFCRAIRHCMNEPIQPVGSGITGGPAWGCSSRCLCPLLPLWSPSSTSAEHRDACSYAGFDRASGSRSCLQQAVAAGANVGPEPSPYLPSTSPSGAACPSGTTCSPTESMSFPPAPVGPHALIPHARLGSRCRAGQDHRNLLSAALC